jgi:hypothetical protein
MSIKGLASKDGTHIQGFIEIEKINKKDHTREVYKNTITNAGKQFLLDKSAALMLGIGADTFGMTGCSNTIAKTGTNESSSKAGRVSRSDRDITNVLLNLDENTLTGLGVSTSFINVFDEDMANAEKVIGYANNNIIATADDKEGTMDYCKGEYMVDPFTVCKRWKYAEGVATGTISAIAMMPAACIMGNDGDGLKFSKCIDKVNTQYTNFASLSDGFLIPGVPGYTGNNEILLNFNRDNNARWKYNIGTGEIESVPNTDNFFIPPLPNEYYTMTDMQMIDNYLYVLYLSNLGGDSYTYVYVYVYDPANSMNQVAQFMCNGAKSGEYPIKASVFKANGDIYVSTVSKADVTITGGGKLWKLNKSGSDGYASSAGAAQTDFSLIGLTVPSGMNINQVGIGQYNGNYVMFNAVKYYDNISSSKSLVYGNRYGYKMVGYVFTDLSDPAGSIIDMIDGITPNEIMFAAGSNAGTLRVGYDKLNNYEPNVFGSVYDMVDDKHIVMNNSANTNEYDITLNTQTKGVYLTLDKWWTNVLSFVKLNTPITKTATDIIYVSYGYKIV